MKLDTSVAVILAVSAVLCLPPFLMLRLTARYYRRAQRHNLPTRRYGVIFALMLVAFAFNLAAMTSMSWQIGLGGGSFSPWHAAAVAIAWVTFWAWLFLTFGLGQNIARRRDPK